MNALIHVRNLSIPSLCVLFALVGFASAEQRISFNYQIRPILSRHCIACHGPDEGDRQADLRLDVEEAAHEYAIVPGEPDDSEVILRIESDDDDIRMPPPDHSKPLSSEEMALLRQWIEQGAQYEPHWSFVAPTRPEPPKPNDADWPFNEIDYFVASGMEKQGLEPAAPAGPHRLIRRVSLGLTGLPPQGHSNHVQDLVAQYVAEPTITNYEQAVDALLESQAYGEHWAAMWLDLARYADTVGYSGDEKRTIWPWRDWVVKSFNDNMPFDQFTVEQLAGDLLPAATTQQRLATAFHRNTLSNNEGGTDDEEFRVVAAKDRISTTMNVWMGLTMRCAECHSHKYDPISQREYYQFLDFFNQTEDADTPDERPRLEVYPLGKETEFARLDEQIAKLKQQQEAMPVVWNVLHPQRTASLKGTEFKVLDDQSVLATGPQPPYDTYLLTYGVGKGRVTGLRLELIPDLHHSGNVGRSLEGSLIISQVEVAVGEDDKQTPKKLTDVAPDFEQVNYEAKHLIRDVVDDKGWAVNHPQDGYRARREAIFTLAEPLDVDQPTELTFSIVHQGPWPYLNTGRVRLSATSVENPAEEYRQQKLDPIGRQLAALEKKRHSPSRVPVMAELPAGQHRDTHVHLRGNFQQPGEKVSADVPAAFPSLPADGPRNRLGVAMWLVSDENPLTARVAVNRFWARLFGMGIVETEEDFGTQGTLPSHPDLLDWLAVDFRESGWDVKRLLKQIVMSSTYRQDSQSTDEQLAEDSRNRYLARGPRYRLPAEMVRDQSLAVSGLLSRKMYGPPVYPPSPIKRIVNAFQGEMLWNVSEGEDRYRRAIYTFIKRSQPHPLFDTFDMSTREVCSLRRFRTNTPLQSLMTLNDESFIEAARALARKMHREVPATGASQRQLAARRVAAGYQAALLEPADDSQIETLANLYEKTLLAYQQDVQDAELMTGARHEGEQSEEVAELAALTVVANVILNLDRFLTN